MSVRNFFANGSGRQIVRKIYLAFIYFYFRLFNQTPNSDACIVFAPHQDDETLGSGGTIIQKKRKGADVKIVFMTDVTNPLILCCQLLDNNFCAIRRGIIHDDDFEILIGLI